MVGKVLQSVVLTSAIVFALVPVAYATSTNTNNPAGNNGFVKINNELAPDTIPENHPHVGCTFSVEFYNFDKGDYKAKVEFSLQSPTTGDGYSLKVASGTLQPFIGGDNAGGGNDLDASQVYKLTFTGKAHEQQGYHVKLLINAPGSQGSDKKQKVFWVSPCVDTKPGTNPGNPGTPGTNPGHVLGDTTQNPGTLPETGAAASLSMIASAVAGAIGYTGRLLHLKRRASK